jgi:phospholipid/cholesterol/gamma-HCH transport system substrate-binding protein
MSSIAGQSSAKRESVLDVAVGAFVLVTLAAGVGAILVLGQKHQVFERRVHLNATFTDVGGLRQGAPVLLSGVNIGTVAKIGFGGDRHNPTVQVELEVARDALTRLGQDSVAHIGSQGLLGDKLVEVSVPSESSGALEPGGAIKTAESADLGKLIDQAGQVMTQAKHVADNLADVVASFADPKVLTDVRDTIASLHKLVRAAEQGPGVVHSLFYDGRQAEHVEKALAGLDELTANLNTAVAQVDRVMAATDADGVQLLNNASRAVKQLGETATRASETLAQVSSAKIIAHLDRASDDLAALTSYVRAGKGTLGSVLVDSTVYEQLVSILGGVQRSRVLRALVRYAISQSDPKSTLRVTDGFAAAPPVTER